MTSDTPKVDALLLVVNEGRVYKDEFPIVNLARDLERALVKFEQAKMPPRWTDAVIPVGGDITPFMQGELDNLRTYAAAEHVRAEEAEANTVGKILRGLRSENDSTQLRAIIASIEASFPDAIRALQGKE